MKATTTLRSRMMVSLISIMFYIGTTSLLAQSPTITSFTPASGSVGTLVTVSGTNLSSPTAFTIGGVNAIVISNTGSSLVGMVMPGAGAGGVMVATAGGAAGTSNFTVTPTSFPSVQQGGKLVGTGGANNAGQGYAVALSADGNTAIIGGPDDTINQYLGAAWVFTRNGGNWTQQGGKLAGTGNVSNYSTEQGWSVSLSADGNTAIVGGWGDDSTKGAAWVFTRSNNTWSQQGPKLVGTGAINANNYFAKQGCAVSLSADGNTAIVGGYGDDHGKGAAWVFTRNGNTWTQQGAKLLGTGTYGAIFTGVNQGGSVSLSADGNTAIIGGIGDNTNVGAVWIFKRSNGFWIQQGAKLVGTGYSNISNVLQGWAVALSADGNTALVGARDDSNYQGAAWVFIRKGNTWTQQGNKLVGTGNVGQAMQGHSVSLSADGNTAIIGGATQCHQLKD